MNQNSPSTYKQIIVQSVKANIRRVNKQFHSRVPTLAELSGDVDEQGEKSSRKPVKNEAPIEITTLERTRIDCPPSADDVKRNLERDQNLLGETTKQVLEKDDASLLRDYQYLGELEQYRQYRDQQKREEKASYMVASGRYMQSSRSPIKYSRSSRMQATYLPTPEGKARREYERVPSPQISYNKWTQYEDHSRRSVSSYVYYPAVQKRQVQRNVDTTPELIQEQKAKTYYAQDSLQRSERSDAADKILLSARKTLEQTYLTLIKSSELDQLYEEYQKMREQEERERLRKALKERRLQTQMRIYQLEAAQQSRADELIQRAQAVISATEESVETGLDVNIFDSDEIQKRYILEYERARLEQEERYRNLYRTRYQYSEGSQLSMQNYAKNTYYPYNTQKSGYENEFKFEYQAPLRYEPKQRRDVVEIARNNLKLRRHIEDLIKASNASNKSLDLDLELSMITNKGDNTYREYKTEQAKARLK